MKRFRLVLIVLVILALTSIAGWRLATSRAATIQPDAVSLALLPQQTTSVFGLDVDGLRSTTLYYKWSQRANEKHNREYGEFVARTGFDPLRDVESVTAGAWRNGDVPSFLAVITARYNASSLASFLKEKNAQVETYRGVEVFLPEKHERHHGDPPAFAFLDDRTILAGGASAVKQAIEQKQTGGPSALNNQVLLTRAQTIGAENQAWAVSMAPGSFLPDRLPGADQAQPNLSRVLKGLEAFTFALNATSDLRLLMQGSCASEDDARMLADAARGILAMLRLAAPANRPEALQVLNSVQVIQNDREVKVTAQVASAIIEQFAEKPELFLPYGQHHRAPEKH